MLSAEQLLVYIKENLGIDDDGIGISTPLFSSSMIDSFSLVSLITFIEETAGVEIDPRDITLENFDSIEKIVAFVERSGNGGSAS